MLVHEHNGRMYTYIYLVCVYSCKTVTKYVLLSIVDTHRGIFALVA